MDWDEIAAMVDEKASGGAIVQHLSKIRERLKSEGHDLPPTIRRPGGRTSQGSATNKSFSSPNQDNEMPWDEDIEMTGMTGDEIDDAPTLRKRLPSQRKRNGPAPSHQLDLSDSFDYGEDDDNSSTAMDTIGNNSDYDEIVGANDPEMRFDSSVEAWPINGGITQHLSSIVQDTSDNGQMSLAPFRGVQNKEQKLSSHLTSSSVNRNTTRTKNFSIGNPRSSSLIVSLPASIINGIPVLRNQTKVMVPPYRKKKPVPKESGSSRPSPSSKVAKESTRPSRPTHPPKPTRPTKPTSSTKKTQPVTANNPANVPVTGQGEQLNAPNVPCPHRQYEQVPKNPMKGLMFNIGDEVDPLNPYLGASADSMTSYNFSHTAPTDAADDMDAFSLARKREEYDGLHIDFDNPSAGTMCPLVAPRVVMTADDYAKDALIRKRLDARIKKIEDEREAARLGIEAAEAINNQAQSLSSSSGENSFSSISHGKPAESSYPNQAGQNFNGLSHDLSRVPTLHRGFSSTAGWIPNEAPLIDQGYDYSGLSLESAFPKTRKSQIGEDKEKALVTGSIDPLLFSWPNSYSTATSANGNTTMSNIQKFQALDNMLDDSNFFSQANPYPAAPEQVQTPVCGNRESYDTSIFEGDNLTSSAPGGIGSAQHDLVQDPFGMSNQMADSVQDSFVPLENTTEGAVINISNAEVLATFPTLTETSLIGHPGNLLASMAPRRETHAVPFIDEWGVDRPLDDFFGDALWGMDIPKHGIQMANETGETDFGDNTQSNQVESSEDTGPIEGQDPTNDTGNID